jgi:hypothetical protein
MSNDTTKLITNKEKLPKAIKEGKIQIGGITIDCAILDNGEQVITQSSILKLMGKSHPGGRPSKAALRYKNETGQIPIFVAANNLIPFIPNTLYSQAKPIIFTPTRGAKAYGYKAVIIPDICDVYLDARNAEKLKGEQVIICKTCEIISRGLSRVGISALIMEACGIPTSEKEYLQNILNEYIEKSLQKWVKRFPERFFQGYKKMYQIENDSYIPSHIGNFINKYVYKELAPGVLDELRKINPIEGNGKRKHAHHQFLTPNKGVIELEKQLIKIVTLMQLSENKKEFDTNFSKLGNQ